MVSFVAKMCCQSCSSEVCAVLLPRGMPWGVGRDHGCFRVMRGRVVSQYHVQNHSSLSQTLASTGHPSFTCSRQQQHHHHQHKVPQAAPAFPPQRQPCIHAPPGACRSPCTNKSCDNSSARRAILAATPPTVAALSPPSPAPCDSATPTLLAPRQGLHPSGSDSE